MTQTFLTSVSTQGDAAGATPKGTHLLVTRQDADTSPVADGAFTGVFSDERGRLKVATQPGSIAPVDRSVSAIQAAANTPVALATAFVDVSRSSNLVAYVTGTFAGMNVSFEASLDSTNGTNGTWFGIQAVRTNANTVETTTGALSAVPAYAWEMSVNAYAWARVRCTARTSGTQVWRLQAGSYATEPIPAIQPHAVTLPALTAGNARIGTWGAAGVWYDSTAAALAASGTFTGTTRDLVGAATATAWAVANYPDSYSVSAMSAVAGGTLYIEVSRDGTTWFRVAQAAMAQPAGGAYYAALSIVPTTRYARAVFVNGATGQTLNAWGVQEITRAA